MFDQPKTTDDPGAPTNDREYQVWEHGRRQGHREAMAAARRARENRRSGDIEDGFIRDNYGE